MMPDSRKGWRILAVDDEEMFLDLLSSYFSSKGYEIIGLGDGYSAMEYIEENPVDLVLLDINLGELNGLEVLKWIKSKIPDLPVIMLTGLGYDDRLVDESTRSGAAWYLSKSLPIELLLKEVRRHLGDPLAGSVVRETSNRCDGETGP